MAEEGGDASAEFGVPPQLQQKQLELSDLTDRLLNKKEEHEQQRHDLLELEDQITGNLTLEARDLCPEDYLDMVGRLESRVKLQEARNAVLEKEVVDVKVQQKQATDRIGAANQLIQRIEGVTGQRIDERGELAAPTGGLKGVGGASRLDHMQQEQVIKELEALKAKIKNELDKSGCIVKHKQQLITRLSQHKFDTDEMEERVYERQNAVNAQDIELKKLAECLEGCRHQHQKADRDIDRWTRYGDETRGTVDSLLRDKEFLQRQKADDAEKGRQQNQIIKTQRKRIEQLQERLQIITEADEDLRLGLVHASAAHGAIDTAERGAPPTHTADILPEDEAIPIALYELLARNKAVIDTSTSMKNVIMLEKEATIEALEQKVEGVAEDTNQEMYDKNYEVGAFESDVKDLNRCVWSDRERFQKEILDLRQANAGLLRQAVRLQNEQKQAAAAQ